MTLRVPFFSSYFSSPYVLYSRSQRFDVYDIRHGLPHELSLHRWKNPIRPTMTVSHNIILYCVAANSSRRFFLFQTDFFFLLQFLDARYKFISSSVIYNAAYCRYKYFITQYYTAFSVGLRLAKRNCTACLCTLQRCGLR